MHEGTGVGMRELAPTCWSGLGPRSGVASGAAAGTPALASNLIPTSAEVGGPGQLTATLQSPDTIMRRIRRKQTAIGKKREKEK